MLKVVLQVVLVCPTWAVQVVLVASLVQVGTMVLQLKRSTDCIRPYIHARKRALQHVEHGVREAVTKWMARHFTNWS